MLSTNTHSKHGAGISTLYQLMEMTSSDSKRIDKVSLKLKLQYIILTSGFNTNSDIPSANGISTHSDFNNILHHHKSFSVLWKQRSSKNNDGLFYLTTNHETAPFQLTLINKSKTSTVRCFDKEKNETSWLITFEETEPEEPFFPFEIVCSDSDTLKNIPSVTKLDQPISLEMSDFNLRLELKDESGDYLKGSYFRHQRSSDVDRKWVLFMRCLGEKLTTKYNLHITFEIR